MKKQDFLDKNQYILAFLYKNKNDNWTIIGNYRMILQIFNNYNYKMDIVVSIPELFEYTKENPEYILRVIDPETGNLKETLKKP